MMKKHLGATIKHDAEIVAGKHNERYDLEFEEDVSERLERGVYLSHEGLVRNMIERVRKTISVLGKES